MNDYKRRLRALAGSPGQPKAQAPTVEIADGVATMRLYDPIDSWGEYWGVSAKEFAEALDQIPSSTTEIRLHINSPGGEVFEGIAILNALRSHKAKVVVIVDGIAASAASAIAAGADELVMAPNSELMIHDAWGLVVGNAADMHQMAELLDHLSNNIAGIYAAKAGGTVDEWRAAMQRETWFSAQEAVDAGLADRVGAASPSSNASNRFDLSIFTYAGRSAAPAPGAPTVEPAPAASLTTDPPAPTSETDSPDPARSDTTNRLRTATLARQHAMTKENL